MIMTMLLFIYIKCLLWKAGFVGLLIFVDQNVFFVNLQSIIVIYFE